MLRIVLICVALVVWIGGMFPASHEYKSWWFAPVWPLHFLFWLAVECPFWLIFWD